MPETRYVNIPVHEEARDSARVTKAEMGVDWSTFLKRAAAELDEETDD